MPRNCYLITKIYLDPDSDPDLDIKINADSAGSVSITLLRNRSKVGWGGRVLKCCVYFSGWIRLLLAVIFQSI
jgi:hypothetical protein